MKKANAWLIFQQRAGDKSSAGASSVMHLPKTKIKVIATANRHKDAIGFTLASYWLRGSDGVSF